MRRHVTVLPVSFGIALCVFMGYYVHQKLANVPPPPPPLTSTGENTEDLPLRYHTVLSDAERQHVLDGQFTVVNSTEEMPPALKQAFALVTGTRPFALADPGQKYQVTDVIEESGLPFRRLVFGGNLGAKWFIHYERGGRGHSYAVVLFELKPEAQAQFLWGGVSSEGARDLDDLRRKIARGIFHDDATYYW